MNVMKTVVVGSLFFETQARYGMGMYGQVQLEFDNNFAGLQYNLGNKQGCEFHAFACFFVTL